MDNGASSYRHFLDGDNNAFSEILDLYRDNLIFFINRTVNNLSVAEELAADTFAELVVSRRYNFSVKFKTYLFAIAHHKTVSYVRKQSRYSMLTLEDVEDKSAEYADFEEDLLRDEQRKSRKQIDNLVYRGKIALRKILEKEGFVYEE